MLAAQPPPDETPQELTQLLSHLERAARLARTLGAGAAEARIRDLEHDRSELSDQLAACEKQVSRLMNLYVASYQLHSTLKLDEVKTSIGEIALNLLGAGKFALLFWRADGSACEIAMAHGAGGLYGGAVYQGGDPIVDATLADGVIRIGAEDDGGAVAAVPLTMSGQTLGALVVIELLEHRPALGDEDRELLDLIAAHAASALVAAGIHEGTERKLRSLESLLELLRR